MPSPVRVALKNRSISPELSVLAAACRATFPGENTRPVQSSSIDWPIFARLAHFHRVEGLAWKSLAGHPQLPDDVARTLKAQAAAIASTNLRNAAESGRLRAAFERAGLRTLFVKGLTLAALAYGDIATKSAIDIDLLIADESLDAATAQLRSFGYGLAEPAGDPSSASLRRWHHQRKESAWLNSETGTTVDLHTRLADSPRLIPSIGLRSTARSIDVARGISLPTLGDDELLAYLAVHGASSAWFRLKWIVDFAAFMQARSIDPAAAAERMGALGAGRAGAQALLLADRFFGTLDSHEALRARLLRDPLNRWLADMSLAQLTACREPTETMFGTWRIHLTQLALQPGVGFAMSEVKRQAAAIIGRLTR